MNLVLVNLQHLDEIHLPLSVKTLYPAMTASSEIMKACYDVIFNGSLSFNVFRESRRLFSWIVIIWVFLDFRARLFAYPLINRHAPVFLILLRLLPLATLLLLELRRRRASPLSPSTLAAAST